MNRRKRAKRRAARSSGRLPVRLVPGASVEQHGVVLPVEMATGERGRLVVPLQAAVALGVCAQRLNPGMRRIVPNVTFEELPTDGDPWLGAVRGVVWKEPGEE